MPMKKWIKFNKSWLDFDKEGLALVGTMVEVKGTQYDPEAVAKYLIGDINEARGVCDDCTAFPKGSIVLRYRKINVPAK
jgi:hypothetical protein